MTKNGRAFLVGDAVHTHSPLVGQGMNVGMQYVSPLSMEFLIRITLKDCRDSYNLGWKLAGVIRKQFDSKILDTFEIERRPVAEQLVEVDQIYLQLFDAPKGKEPEWLLERAAQLEPFLMGLSVNYSTSPLTALSSTSTQATNLLPSDLSERIIPGRRFPEMTVYNHASGKLYPLQRLLRANGNFHVIVFAGDISQLEKRNLMNRAGTGLESIQKGLQLKLNIFAIHRTTRAAVELANMHDIFFPFDETMGRDYDRVYCDLDVTYEEAGIDIGGGIVVVRPDQYVSWTGGLDNTDGLREYFEHVFRT